MNNMTAALKRIIITVALLCMATTFLGCRNTARGVGQDVERTGEKIQDATRP